MKYQADGFRLVQTWWDTATRYQQIKRYTDRAGLADWVAVDDQPEGWGADDLGKLVHTNGETGLSDARVLALLADRLSALMELKP
jgi:hypothetical protein